MPPMPKVLRNALKHVEQKNSWQRLARQSSQPHAERPREIMNSRSMSLVSILNRQIIDANARLRRLDCPVETENQLRLIAELNKHLRKELQPVAVCA